MSKELEAQLAEMQAQLAKITKQAGIKPPTKRERLKALPFPDRAVKSAGYEGDYDVVMVPVEKKEREKYEEAFAERVIIAIYVDPEDGIKRHVYAIIPEEPEDDGEDEKPEKDDGKKPPPGKTEIKPKAKA